MAAVSPTITYDDGLYHPPTPTASLPSLTIVPIPTIPTAAADSLVPLLVTPSSAVQLHPQITITSQNIKTSSQSGNTSTFSSSSIPSSRPSNQATQVAQPNSPQNSTPLILGVFVCLFLFVGIVFFFAYLNRNTFRTWRAARRDRKQRGIGTISGGRYQEADRMLEVGSSDHQRMYEKEHLADDQSDAYTPSDPFARSIPRRSLIQSYLASRDPSTTNPIEHVDDERGWLWGTRRSTASHSQPAVTPGLGTGRYRAKSTLSRSSTRRPKLDDRLISSSAYSASAYSEHASYSPGEEMCETILNNPEALDAELNEYLAESRTTVTSREYADQMKGSSGSRGAFTPMGAAYLLERLKNSISGRSNLPSLRSSRGAGGSKDSGRGRWNEIGQWEDPEDYNSETEKTITLDIQSSSKTRSSHFRPRELSLADIPLPEVPLLAWDLTSSPSKERFRDHSGHTTDEDLSSQAESAGDSPVRRSTRGWTLSDQAPPPISFTAALRSKPTKKPDYRQQINPTRTADREAIRNSLSMSPSQVLSPDLQPDLFFTASSPPHQRKPNLGTQSGIMNAFLGTSDQVYSLTGIAQLIFPNSNEQSSQVDKSVQIDKVKKTNPLDSETYTALPNPRSQRRRPRGESESRVEPLKIRVISPPPRRRPAIKHRVPSREFDKEPENEGDREPSKKPSSSQSPVRTVHPGGFVGKTPTKKLKKRTVIGTSARTNLQLKREHERAFDTIEAIVRSSPSKNLI